MNEAQHQREGDRIYEEAVDRVAKLSSGRDITYARAAEVAARAIDEYMAMVRYHEVDVRKLR